MNIGKIDFGSFPVALAPMEDITDTSFRCLCKDFGADIVYTEFVSSEGLVRDAKKSLDKLHFSEKERPIGVQIFGSNPEAMKKAALFAEKAKPDFIDLNFGCPVRKVVSKGAGAALLKDIPKMITIASEVVKSVSLPITAKTRLGWDESDKPVVEVVERLQDVGVAAVTIHARTRTQLYSGKADWTLIGEVKNNPGITIPVIGNGDIDSPEKALEMKQKYGVDGIMIGRASVGNSWIFKRIRHYLQNGELLPLPSTHERLQICKQHLKNAIEWKGEKRAVVEMRKHYAGYFKGIDFFKKNRLHLMAMQSSEEIFEFIGHLLNT